MEKGRSTWLQITDKFSFFFLFFLVLILVHFNILPQFHLYFIPHPLPNQTNNQRKRHFFLTCVLIRFLPLLCRNWNTQTHIKVPGTCINYIWTKVSTLKITPWKWLTIDRYNYKNSWIMNSYQLSRWMNTIYLVINTSNRKLHSKKGVIRIVFHSNYLYDDW